MEQVKITCPNCGQNSELVNAMAGETTKPLPGAVSICSLCFSINQLKTSGEWQKMDDLDFWLMEQKYPGFTLNIKSVAWHMNEIKKGIPRNPQNN